MYLSKINKFLANYSNYKKSYFKNILDWSNTVWFDSYKLEKDFLLTLILIKFWEKYPELIFKWWTCLNKMYFPYFRLSEDLDFVINTDDLWQTSRKKFLKDYENKFVEDLNILWITLTEERTKFDSYRVAMFNFEYKSVINNSIQNIKLDISIKNNLYLKPIPKKIQSLFVDKVLEESIFWEHIINCIDLKEAVSEKIRAWLTRSTPAIRDFFDIWYIKNNSNFNFQDEELLKLINIKLKEVDYKYSLEGNYELLEKQIETDLKPVLNEDFDFNFNEIYNFILTFKNDKE